MWSVGTILNGLLSFMYDTQPTTGSINTSKAEKERLARESLAFNVKNPIFRKLFPDWVEEHERRTGAQAESRQGQQEATAGAGVDATPLPGAQQAQHGGQPGAAHGQAGPGGAGPGAGGQPQPGSTMVTLAIIVVVIAAVVVPLLNNRGTVVHDLLNSARGGSS